MQLLAKELVGSLTDRLKTDRKKIKHQPGLALIWVGENPQTAAFIRAKQRLAKELGCDFSLHHFPPGAPLRQLAALIEGLSAKKEIDGIVLQLPLPAKLPTNRLIDLIEPAKDIDGLTTDSPFPAPTATGIVALLQYHQIAIEKRKTVIIGTGRLVGEPLAKIWRQNGWSQVLVVKDAARENAKIRQADLLIAATGVPGLVEAKMVHQKMVVVDGSGVDVAVELIEPLVEAVTPARGAIGPLTVRYLFANLLRAASLND
ncbi:MAG: bifunctional 5,10-methylenetetrahydrofolate dehydrogenase/5,10-methenyltetrahydrofolate cyclohydrolase [Patescibacteria group bacterium]